MSEEEHKYSHNRVCVACDPVTDPEETKKDEVAAKIAFKAFMFTLEAQDREEEIKKATGALSREIRKLSGTTEEYKESIRSRAMKMIENAAAEHERERQAAIRRKRERGGNTILLIVVLLGLLIAFLFGKW